MRKKFRIKKGYDMNVGGTAGGNRSTIAGNNNRSSEGSENEGLFSRQQGQPRPVNRTTQQRIYGQHYFVNGRDLTPVISDTDIGFPDPTTTTEEAMTIARDYIQNNIISEQMAVNITIRPDLHTNFNVERLRAFVSHRSSESTSSRTTSGILDDVRSFLHEHEQTLRQQEFSRNSTLQNARPSTNNSFRQTINRAVLRSVSSEDTPSMTNRSTVSIYTSSPTLSSAGSVPSDTSSLHTNMSDRQFGPWPRIEEPD